MALDMSNQVITSELLNDDPDLIDLIDRFLSRLLDMQEKIIKKHDDQDWETFLDLIHQMKGVGGNYGYPMLTTLCADIELKTKEEKHDDVSNKLIEFKLMCEKILAGKDENHKLAKQ